MTCMSMFLSLYFSLPSTLSKNKYIFFKGHILYDYSYRKYLEEANL